jgi:hypothetical protein
VAEIMRHADPRYLKEDAKHDRNANINDNDEIPTKTVTFTELAAAMQTDEDALLRKLATIFRNREEATDMAQEKE